MEISPRPSCPIALRLPGAHETGERVARALVWFRRGLRVADHPAPARALRDAETVWCVFVLDKAVLAELPREDRRVAFIRASLRWKLRTVRRR